jgi:CRP-like cAMP-binding protein
MSGDIIGELALVDGEPRSATVTACQIEPSSAVVVDQAVFRRFLDDYPSAAVLLARAIGKKLRWANRRRVEFGACSVKVRAARVIVELAAAYGRQLPYNGTTIGTALSQGEFASLVGAAPQTIQRALRELRDAGLIDTGYRALVAMDLPGLRAVAGLPCEENPSF